MELEIGETNKLSMDTAVKNQMCQQLKKISGRNAFPLLMEV
jgi:hypothetical protein